MELECDRIAKYVLPAVRVSVAEGMKNEYSMSQQKIAQKLGVAQVAVSKYLNGRYSDNVKRIRDYIIKKKLADKIIKSAAGSSHKDALNIMMEDLCARIINDDNIVV